MGWDQDFIRWANKTQTLLGPKANQEVKSCLGTPGLERAPNAIEWTIGSQFLKVPSVIDKFKRQYQIIRDVFALRCPLCNKNSPEAIDCFLKTRMELESELLFVWNESEKDDVCPKCRSTRRGLIEDGLIEPIDTLVGIAGMRSSKSVLCGILATYIEHELAVIGDVSRYFDILPGDPLQVSFVASNQTQSKDTIFAKFKALRRESPWMGKYIAFVKEREVQQQAALGIKKWDYSEEAEGQIHNGLIDVNFRALNTNSAGLAGATRIAAFLDEISRFQLSDSKMSAMEVVAVMDNGLKTVRGSRDRLKLRPWWGFFGAVSSPISIEDQGMVMMKQGRVFAAGSISGPKNDSIPGTYSFHYPTWLFNADLPRSSFDTNYMRDPIGAARDFGAQPPNAETPFIDDEARFRQAIDFAAKPSVQFQKTEPEDRTGRKYVGAKITSCKYDPYHTHYLHFDAGASFDTFGGCSAHGEWVAVEDPITKMSSRKWVTVIDWVLGIQPVLGKTQAEKRSVWFDSLVEVLTTLLKSQKIGLVTFDRWNSEMLIQNIRNLGITTENKSVKVEDFMSFLKSSYEGDVKLLPPRPDEPSDPRNKNGEEKAIYELLRLERSPDLKKIYNPKKGSVHGMNSDDLAQVVVGAHMNVQSSVVSISDSTSIAAVLKREQAGGVNHTQEQGGRLARGRRW